MKKEDVSKPYFEHARMMHRLVGFTHFHPIHYLALTLLEETDHLSPSEAEIETIAAQIKTNLGINVLSLDYSLPTEYLEELPHFCPINYLAIMLLEESSNLDPSMAEIEAMEANIKTSLARMKENFHRKEYE